MKKVEKVKAEEYSAHHVEEEPCDCQMEFLLYSYKI